MILYKKSKGFNQDSQICHQSLPNQSAVQMQQYCRAIVCEGLAQGPHVVARVGFEPATFWTQGNKPTTLHYL